MSTLESLRIPLTQCWYSYGQLVAKFSAAYVNGNKWESSAKLTSIMCILLSARETEIRFLTIMSTLESLRIPLTQCWYSHGQVVAKFSAA